VVDFETKSKANFLFKVHDCAFVIFKSCFERINSLPQADFHTFDTLVF